VANPTRRKTLPEAERIRELQDTLNTAVVHARRVRREMDKNLGDYRDRDATRVDWKRSTPRNSAKK
jgi:hypothetical protein